MQIDIYKEEMAARIDELRQNVAEAAAASRREAEDITIIGVSKFFPSEKAKVACELGFNDLGENRVQEMLEKIDALSSEGLNPNWHMIGTLQKNKVKYILGKTHLIHSVDSESLLNEISRRSSKQGLQTRILIQVNISGEVSKHGFSSDEVLAGIEKWSLLPGVEIRGLMTMAPIVSDPEETMPVFMKARDLALRIQDLVPRMRFDILSMGMSQDYKQAIRCGATHIRIGTAVFGSRT